MELELKSVSVNLGALFKLHYSYMELEQSNSSLVYFLFILLHYSYMELELNLNALFEDHSTDYIIPIWNWSGFFHLVLLLIN